MKWLIIIFSEYSLPLLKVINERTYEYLRRNGRVGYSVYVTVRMIQSELLEKTVDTISNNSILQPKTFDWRDDNEWQMNYRYVSSRLLACLLTRASSSLLSLLFGRFEYQTYNNAEPQNKAKVVWLPCWYYKRQLFFYLEGFLSFLRLISQ